MQDSMENPWLGLSLDDYEGHMRAAGVEQLGALAELFAEALAVTRPPSVAILGIAGGNGLDAVDPSVTRRVVGIDINPAYLDATRRRFATLPNLELHCRDLSAGRLALDPVALVHAALVFEHAGAERCLENARSLVAPGGCLSVVLQLPSATEGGVSRSPFPAIQALARTFSLVDRAAFVRQLAASGCALLHESTRPLPAGKAFWLGIFRA
jgi:SAM-dependent methyltransferase